MKWTGGFCRLDKNAGGCSHFPPYTIFYGYDIGVESCVSDALLFHLSSRILFIEETNALLDIHIREHDDALVSGMSEEGIKTLREVQKRELKDAEEAQIRARFA